MARSSSGVKGSGEARACIQLAHVAEVAKWVRGKAPVSGVDQEQTTRRSWNAPTVLQLPLDRVTFGGKGAPRRRLRQARALSNSFICTTLSAVATSNAALIEVRSPAAPAL